MGNMKAPPKVEYSLTDLGKSSILILKDMKNGATRI